MAGTVTLIDEGDCARVQLANPGKLNAIDVAMWVELRATFERLQALPPAVAPSVVIVCGADGQFASGGDIAEFAQFRFDESALRHFHEQQVAPALQAMLDCDIPLLAQIDGVCVGGGLEIAACCDLRVCDSGSRFGAPIARLGFPMAPQELQVVARLVREPVLREMLLEARMFNATEALHHGLVHEVAAPGTVAASVAQRAARLAGLSPQAARINKRSLRQLARGGATEDERYAHFNYADRAEHREGVMAFIEKRPPRFQRG
jgi:enoyl-CoA hydratase